MILTKAQHVALCLLLLLWLTAPVRAELMDTIARIKPSLVVVGTFNKLKSPQFSMRGTGFAIGDGTLIATNSHVIPEGQSADSVQDSLMILARQGMETRPFPVQLVARDMEHDLALLRLAGKIVLPPLQLGFSDSAREGQAIAFAGFPIGGALGFSPVTHRGIISSITPIAIPIGNANQLKDQSIRRLRSGAFPIFQLDGTAYPGNSGGPLFDPEDGYVLGVINMVFVKSTKESVLEKPSGISYAIPSRHLSELLKKVEQ